jgi:hypothetical protein
MAVVAPQEWFVLNSVALTFAAIYVRLVAQRRVGGFKSVNSRKDISGAE